tara:strand:+ start:203 stop:475 length:273 start_codon:yes stop_codon:yes gene_type:complete
MKAKGIDIHLRIHPDQKEVLDRLKEEDGTTITNAVHYALEEYLPKKVNELGKRRRMRLEQIKLALQLQEERAEGSHLESVYKDRLQDFVL